MIRKEIIKTFNLPKIIGKQLKKSFLLERVSVTCECTKNDVSKVYSQMKKEGIIYSVVGLPGWIT